jgi:hypothetical protein
MAWIAEQMMPVHMHVEKVKNIPFYIINTLIKRDLNRYCPMQVYECKKSSVHQ